VDLGQQVDRRLQAGARRHGTSRDGRRDLPAGGREIKAGGGNRAMDPMPSGDQGNGTADGRR
jgi:hypothetical protein